MNRNCDNCASAFTISEDELAFYDKLSPTFNHKKFHIPPPKRCPLCRQQLRLAFRNERNFYHRKCALTGRNIVSTYSPDSPFKVYDQNAWWGDDWDGLDYGRDYDFDRSLTEQLRELNLAVPHISLYTVNVENSYYTNFALNQKNVYLVFGAGDDEDCMYGKFLVSCKDLVEGLTVFACEFCYEGVASDDCYGCRFFVNSRNCKNSLMIEGCKGCSNCIVCFGLQNKQYCIMNKQYSKGEYEKFAKEYEYLTHDKIDFLREKLGLLKKDLPHVESHIYASENCTGDGVYNCKNCHSAFDAKNCEDCKYIHFCPNSVETQDCCFCAPDGVEFCYNVCSIIKMNNCMAIYLAGQLNDCYYSIECHNNRNLFGCVGLKHKQYCILNKKYSQDEYESLVAQIVEQMQKTGEWGEYLDISLSAFSYNETIANEYFPLKKEKALKFGSKWREADTAEKNVDFYTPPADIRDVDNDICKRVLKCSVTGRPFKIVPQELKFYRRMKVPIPKVCPDQRHLDRLKLHTSKQLWSRKCMKCGGEIMTVYSPEQSEKVYCKGCYLKEVY